MINLGNLITAMVTPFKADMSIDFDEAVRLANYLIDTGTDSIVLHGTTGESPTLSHEEEYELYRVILKGLGGRAKIIAGTGSNSTATTIKSTVQAEKIGCDAAMLVVPYYNKPSQEGMFQHFKAVAENTKLPMIIYNIPGRTGVNMLPETVARVAQIENYIGLKDAAGSVDQTSSNVAILPKDFTIWSGDDSLTLPMLSVGAVGVISVAAHVAGRMIADMIKAFHAGDLAKAQSLHIKLLPLFKVLFLTSNPTLVKFALTEIGFKVGIPRLPLVDANDKEKESVRKVLKELGITK